MHQGSKAASALPEQASFMDNLQPLDSRRSQPCTSKSSATSHHLRNYFAAATAAILADQNSLPSGNLDNQENPPPRRAIKRRLSLRSRQDSFRRPRPLTLDRAAKSSSAVPTLTDLAVGGNQTKSTRTSPSVKSWLGREPAMASRSNSNNSRAEDLLRQTMMHK